MLTANKDDPLGHYLNDTPDADKNPTRAVCDKVGMYLGITNAVRRNEAWTVDGGDSLIMYSAAVNSVPRRRQMVDCIISKFITYIIQAFRVFSTKEQKIRLEELGPKLKNAVEEAFGDRVAELFSIDGLATVPEKQGRGYASLLVEHVTAIADDQCRGTWLITNLSTTGFYARLGFVTVKEFAVGENNPTWPNPPVVICVMLREAKAFRYGNEKAYHKC